MSFQMLVAENGWSIADRPWICNLPRGHEGKHSWETWHIDIAPEVSDSKVLPFRRRGQGSGRRIRRG